MLTFFVLIGDGDANETNVNPVNHVTDATDAGDVGSTNGDADAAASQPPDQPSSGGEESNKDKNENPTSLSLEETKLVSSFYINLKFFNLWPFLFWHERENIKIININLGLGLNVKSNYDEVLISNLIEFLCELEFVKLVKGKSDHQYDFTLFTSSNRP